MHTPPPPNQIGRHTFHLAALLTPGESEAIINSTHDWTYAEYTDVRDWSFDKVYFRELYDVRADPFQLRNIWPTASTATQAELHALLRREFACKGASCEF